MSRFSSDQYKDGKVFNGFDYALQVWVKEGRVQMCGHLSEECGCNQRKYSGMKADRARVLDALEMQKIADAHLKAAKQKGAL